MIYINDLKKMYDYYKWHQYFNELQLAGILNHVIDAGEFQSGGGFEHLFLMMPDKRIISLHMETSNIELSFEKWKSISDYINAPYDGNTPFDNDLQERGFGYEQEFAFKEKRCFEDISLENMAELLLYYFESLEKIYTVGYRPDGQDGCDFVYVAANNAYLAIKAGLLKYKSDNPDLDKKCNVNLEYIFNDFGKCIFNSYGFPTSDKELKKL